jgi:hypothetical protein
MIYAIVNVVQNLVVLEYSSRYSKKTEVPLTTSMKVVRGAVEAKKYG